MGHESFIDWISPEIALAYFLAVTVVLIGVLQLAGAHWDRPELRWSRSRWGAALLGLALVVAGTAAFYGGMQRLIFEPGLAGTELIVLFGIAAVLATLVVRLVAGVLGRGAGQAASAPPVTAAAPTMALTPATAAVQSAGSPDGRSLPDDAAWVVPPRDGVLESQSQRSARRL